MKTIGLRLPLEMALPLLKPVRGQGGYQALLRRVQESATVYIRMTPEDFERMVKAQRYASSGFRSRMPTTARGKK